MALRLHGVSPEIADHVGRVLVDAADLLKQHGLSRSTSQDDAGRTTLTEAIRRSGKFPLSVENKGSLRMFQDFFGAELFEFDLEKDLAVLALAQHLVFSGLVTPAPADTHLQVLEKFSAKCLDAVVRHVVRYVGQQLINQGTQGI